MSELVQLKSGELLEGKRLLGFRNDAIKVLGNDAAIRYCSVFDTGGNTDKSIGEEAHRDAIQPIGSSSEYYHGQFALAELSNLTIERCTLLGLSNLQLIFCSDGLLRNINILSNSLYTQGDHWITLNGLVSGQIKGNINLVTGDYAPIVLNPARVGARSDNDPYPNVWISSFLDLNDNYQSLESIVLDDTVDHVLDNRFIKNRLMDIYLDNFDLARFKALVKNVEAEGVEARCVAFKELAFECGDVCRA